LQSNDINALEKTQHFCVRLWERFYFDNAETFAFQSARLGQVILDGPKLSEEKPSYGFIPNKASGDQEGINEFCLFSNNNFVHSPEKIQENNQYFPLLLDPRLHLFELIPDSVELDASTLFETQKLSIIPKSKLPSVVFALREYDITQFVCFFHHFVLIIFSRP
jgi:hypothetical protein